VNLRQIQSFDKKTNAVILKGTALAIPVSKRSRGDLLKKSKAEFLKSQQVSAPADNTSQNFKSCSY
jgi:hypothetical protein